MTTERNTVLFAEFKCLSSSAEIYLSIDIVASLLTSLLIDDRIRLQLVLRSDRAVIFLEE